MLAFTRERDVLSEVVLIRVFFNSRLHFLESGDAGSGATETFPNVCCGMFFSIMKWRSIVFTTLA